MKAATGLEIVYAFDKKFQSTPPVKAATLPECTIDPNDFNISIHAAREGGDVNTTIHTQIIPISIHAAREGGDVKPPCKHRCKEISIHAAREGGDCGNE